MLIGNIQVLWLFDQKKKRELFAQNAQLHK